MEDLIQNQIRPGASISYPEMTESAVFIQSKWRVCLNKVILLPCRRAEVFETVLYVIISTVVMAVIGDTLENENVKEDSKRKPMVIVMMIVTPISTICGILVMKARVTMWGSIAAFMGMWIAPLLGLGVYLGQKWDDLDIVTVLVLSYIPGNVTYFTILRVIRTGLTARYNHNIASIVTSSICILVPFIIISGIIYKIALTSAIDKDFINFLVNAFSVPYLLTLILIWFFIHASFFPKYESSTEEQKQKYLGDGIPDISVQAALKENPLMFESFSPKWWKAIQEHAHIISSGMLLGIMLVIEGGLIGLLDEYGKGEHGDDVFWMIVFYMPAVPIFLISGIIFSASVVKKDDKVAVGSLVVLIIPVMIIMPVSYELYKYSDTEIIGLVLAIGYPSAVLYWISLSILFHHHKRSYQLMSSILCFSLVVPVGFLFPFYTLDTVQNTTFWIIFSLICFGGFLMLVIFFIVDFFRNISKQMAVIALKIRRLEWYDISQWVYTASFILSFSLLVWTFFWTSDYQKSEYGLVAGCFTVITFCFICSLIIHRITLYIKSLTSPELHMYDIIMTNSSKSSALEIELQSKKKRYQKIISILGVTIPIIIIVPSLAATDASDVTISLSITLGIGSSIVFITAVLFLELKSYLKQYGKIVINYGLGCCWCFIILPLVCLIPVTILYADDTQDLNTISSWSIGFVLFLMMIGVSSISIALNIVFKRMEYEKMAKYCCVKMRGILRKSAVRSRLEILRIIFDQVYLSGGSVVNDVLLDGTSIYFWPVDEDDPDLSVNKELVTIEELHKLEMKAGEIDIFEEEKESKKEISCWQYILKICSNKDQDEQIRVVEDLQPEELGKLADNYIMPSPYPPPANNLNKDESIHSSIELQTNRDEDAVLPVSNPAPQIDGTNTMKTLFLHQATKHNWTNAIKELVNHDKEQKLLQMNYLIQSLYKDYPSDLPIDNDAIEAKKLDEDKIQKITASKHFLSLKQDQNARNTWYNKVFNRFSHGMIMDDKGPWMTLYDVREFIRLTGLKSKIPNASCDIIYVKLTRKFTSARTQKTFTKIRYEEFLNDLVRICGRCAYPKLSAKESTELVFEKYIYPNLITNLPYLGIPDMHDNSPKKQKSLMIMGGVLLNRSLPLHIEGNEVEKKEERKFSMFANIGKNEMSFEDDPARVMDHSERNELIRPVEMEDFNTPKAIEQDAMSGIDLAINNYITKKSSIYNKEDPKSPKLVRRATLLYNSKGFEIKEETQDQSSNFPKGFKWIDKLLDNFIRCISLFLELFTGLLKFLIQIFFEICNPTPKQQKELFNQAEATELPEVLTDQDEILPENVRKESPEWPEIAKLITDSFTLLLTEVKEAIKHQNSTEMEINSGNIMFIVGHFLEVCGYAAVAFSSQVGWAQGNSQSGDASDAVLVDNQFWVEIFWTCLALSIVFALISPRAIQLAKSGTLGLNKDRSKAKFPSPQFFLAKLISLIGKSAYLTIMKAFLNVFSCTYDDSNGDWYVTRNSDLTCFSSFHSMYIGLAVIGLILYYPGSTLLYPNIQYQDKSLDLKFDTTFLVIEAQGKVIIAGVVAFFALERYLWLHLIVSLAVLVILALLCGFMKPCIVRSYNIWKVGGYVASAWCCCWALINIYAGIGIACFITLWVGLVMLLILLIAIQYRLYGCNITKLKHLKAALKGREVVDDAVSRNNSIIKSQEKLA